MSEMLSCKGIYKRYGNKEVLKGINLDIEKGKIYGLIGRNGVGKTTLLSIMTGQSMASEGVVTLDGEKVWENKDVINKICFSRELNPMAVMGNNNIKVKEYLRIASIFYPNWDSEMADELIKEFELNVKKQICKLSKGMMSMVTIIVALASKSEFTFLDEPVAGLDVVARDQFYRALLDEYDKTGRTFVISTHIIEEAADIFEEVIIMKNGQVILKENTVELLDRAFHISEKAEEVDKLVEGMEVHHRENIGRSKGVTVLAKPGERINANADVSVQPVNLQNLFVALCGKGE